jgi:hypothetical protein
MDEGILLNLADSLEKSTSPHLQLATLYSQLFDCDLTKSEWGLLRKYLKLYGRWIIYDAMIRTATAATLDRTKSIWPYLITVANALLNEERNKRLKQQLREQEQKNTMLLITSLQQIQTEITTTGTLDGANT